MYNEPKIDKIIGTFAAECGFCAASVVPFDLLDDHQKYLAEWLDGGNHAGMSYMERSLPIRHDMRALFADVKSVVVTLTSYSPVANNGPRAAAFAQNFEDYHRTIKDRLHTLLALLRRDYPELRGRPVVDSAPTFERAWAVRAGLGWVGRSSMLINPRFGGYTLIGLLLLDNDFDLESKPLPEPLPDGCGACSCCRDSCPTGAILDNRTIDARLCMSYHTTQSREPIPPSISALQGDRLYGCDTCLEACPYNQKLKILKLDSVEII